MAEKTTEFILLFHKNITKLCFPLAQYGPKSLQSVNKILFKNRFTAILEKHNFKNYQDNILQILEYNYFVENKKNIIFSLL